MIQKNGRVTRRHDVINRISILWCLHDTTLELSLGEDLVGHGQTSGQSNSVRQTSSWLWYTQLVDERVDDARNSEDTEVPKSYVRGWVCRHIEEPKKQEEWNVLQIVEMISSDSLHGIVIEDNFLPAKRPNIFRIRKYPASYALNGSQGAHCKRFDGHDSAIEGKAGEDRI